MIEQFKKRQERDNEDNQKLKNRLQKEALIELRKATELPIEIAELCIKLADFSLLVFENGFQAARGDSGVALSSSLSGLTGCLSIISLNLQSFPSSSWTDDIKTQRQRLRRAYKRLASENVELMNILDEEAELKGAFLAEFVEIRKQLFGKKYLKDSEIEKLARKIQNALWKYKELIWSKDIPNNLLGVLKAEKVIKLLKYAFHKVDTLGVNESNEEIAGIINRKDYTIKISSMYSPNVVNFTTAHELGHALLHDQVELHRDIPLDGSDVLQNQSITERQASKFAAYFLMPSKIVVQLFYDIFQTKRFQLNELTSFKLGYSSPQDLRKNIRNKRELSRFIAKCDYYDSRSFNSLSKTFKVSIEAMAIRLEELNLIKFE